MGQGSIYKWGWTTTVMKVSQPIMKNNHKNNKIQAKPTISNKINLKIRMLDKQPQLSWAYLVGRGIKPPTKQLPKLQITKYNNSKYKVKEIPSHHLQEIDFWVHFHWKRPRVVVWYNNNRRQMSQCPFKAWDQVKCWLKSGNCVSALPIMKKT